MKNLKFKVQVTPAQSAEIQRAILEKGGKWADGTTDVKHTDKSFLVVRNGRMTCTNSETNFHDLDPEIQQWFAHNALERIKKITHMYKYVTDEYDNVIAVRTSTSRDTAILSREKITRNSPGLAYMWVLEDTTQYDFTREDQPPLVTMIPCRPYLHIMRLAQDYCSTLNYKLNKEG